MELGNVILDTSRAAAGVAALAVVGLVVWWLVRKRQKRVWLPTIRIMELESRLLPRLLLRPPPILPFLCFLTCALVITGFALRPRTQVFTPFEPNQTRIHVFLDMSASLGAQGSIGDYSSRAQQLVQSLSETGRVTVSTSHGPKVLDGAAAAVAPVGSAAAGGLATELAALGFHRGGLRLGSALKSLIEQLGEVDRLFIVSDRDQHTWSGFNWKYLLDEMDVVFYDMAQGKTLENVFVNDGRFLSAPGAPTMDWDVEVARRGGGTDVEGKLDVVFKEKVIASFPWKLSAARQRVSVRASWPVTAIEELARGAAEEPLLFRLGEVDAAANALAVDDEYRTELLGLRQDVLIVAESAGERTLEDPTNQLSIALSVLGFRNQRFDFVKQPGPPPGDFPFWVIVAGAGAGVDRFCPKSIPIARAEMKGKQGAKDFRRRGGMPRIWLAPHAVEADYKELCQCYARLVLNAPNDEAPEYCEHVQSRANYIGLLPSLGAKQIGGEMGDATGSLAFVGKDAAGSGLEVMAFTVPLAPSVQTGINHAQLPVLVRELLRWQGVLEPTGGAAAAAWPRVDDVAESWEGPAAAGAVQPTPPPPEVQARARLTNVPLGESLLAESAAEALPPRWTSQKDWADKQLPAKKDREDPLPWLKLAAIIATAATALEALALLISKTLGIVLKKPEAAVLLLAALGGALAAPKAEAKVDFNLLGYNEGPITLQTLSREVEHRTSVKVETKPNLYPQLSPESLEDPWLWVRDASTVLTPQGRLKGDVALWLKRGGFLVIEATMAPERLSKMTEGLEQTQPGEAGWMPLPPDHEIMRSFYLLDALPSCNGEIWRGFQYDGRLAIMQLPYGFLSTIKDRGAPAPCQNAPDQERSVRVFVNLIMVALATDYKKDQIHLPEILKRLR